MIISRKMILIVSNRIMAEVGMKGKIVPTTVSSVNVNGFRQMC